MYQKFSLGNGLQASIFGKTLAGSEICLCSEIRTGMSFAKTVVLQPTIAWCPSKITVKFQRKMTTRYSSAGKWKSLIHTDAKISKAYVSWQNRTAQQHGFIKTLIPRRQTKKARNTNALQHCTSPREITQSKFCLKKEFQWYTKKTLMLRLA